MRLRTNLLAFCAIFFFASSSFAQHSLQVDDGAGHYSTIVGSNPGATFTLPPGPGTVTLITGSGNQNFLTKWTNAGATAIGNSLLSDNGTTITVGGVLNMNSHQINNVSNPTSAQDAATKAYVDAQSSSSPTAPIATGIFAFNVLKGGYGSGIAGTGGGTIYTVAHVAGSGVYTITFPGIVCTTAPDPMIATGNNFGGVCILNVNWISLNPLIWNIHTYNTAGVHVDNDFGFTLMPGGF